MEETLTDFVQSTKQFKIGGFSMTFAMASHEAIRSRRWNVGGYDWEVRVYPMHFSTIHRCECVSLDLHLCSEAPTYSNLKAKISCRLIDPNGKLKPYQGSAAPGSFKRSGENLYAAFVVKRETIQSWGYLKDDSFIIECTLTVLRELTGMSIATGRPANDLVSSSASLPSDLGELLHQGTGADIMFLVSGESFQAHKAILASRSPVFMAEFFGHMKEERSQQVEIKDMEPSVFGAMLRFIYTDSAPALHQKEDAMAIAQHLLVAADRYGIDRLKSICEEKLYDGVNVETAASTLELAEQHNCLHLKSKCLELISANLEDVMATEGYKNLMASCPLVLMNDLLKAVHGIKN